MRGPHVLGTILWAFLYEHIYSLQPVEIEPIIIMPILQMWKLRNQRGYIICPGHITSN